MKIDIFTFIFWIRISVINHSPSMKFHIPTQNIPLEGTISQIFYIGHRFYVMKS